MQIMLQTYLIPFWQNTDEKTFLKQGGRIREVVGKIRNLKDLEIKRRQEQIDQHRKI